MTPRDIAFHLATAYYRQDRLLAPTERQRILRELAKTYRWGARLPVIETPTKGGTQITDACAVLAATIEQTHLSTPIFSWEN